LGARGARGARGAIGPIGWGALSARAQGARGWGALGLGTFARGAGRPICLGAFQHPQVA